MQRHPALAPLSREHHFALQLAGRLQKKRPPSSPKTIEPTARDLREQVRAAFPDKLDAHFDVEERLIVPAVYGRDIELDALCSDVVREHAEMRALASELSAPGLGDAQCDELLVRLGAALEAHVRLEERLFFPRIESVLDEAALGALSLSISGDATGRREGRLPAARK